MHPNSSARSPGRALSVLFIWNKDVRNPSAGGGTIEFFAIMKWLVSRGYEVTQVSGGFPGAKDSENIDGVNIVRMGTIYSMPMFLWKKQILGRFIDKFDVVVEGLGYVSLFLPILTRKPVLVVCAHLPKEVFSIEGPIELGRPLGSLAAPIARFVESVLTPRVYRNAKIFTFSESSRSDMVETGFHARNILMVPYALANYTTRTEDILKHSSFGNGRPTPKDPGSIVCIGRLRKYKGVQDLIRAVPKISSEVPNLKVRIVGRGQYEEELKRLTKSLRLDDLIEFCGYVSTEEKFKLILASEVLVMPSYKEGFATPVFEAQLCGTVPVVSDAVGVRDLVIPGKTGLVFPRGQPMALADCAIKLLENDELMSRMRQDGFQAVSSINWKQNEQLFLDSFEEEVRKSLESQAKK